MSYYFDSDEDLDEQLQAQIRKFRKDAKGTGWNGWYRIQRAIAKAQDYRMFHDKVENFALPNLFDEDGNAIDWYHWRDPQEAQVNQVLRNLKVASRPSRKRGKVSSLRLRTILKEIVEKRVKEYLNPTKNMEKLKILCILGESGAGKTLASLHLKYHQAANVICSFTTRPPRETEVEGRDHHFIDIVPDRTELLAYAHFGNYYYYALKSQVFGPCTVYVIDEKGLKNLREDYGDKYEIHTVLIRRAKYLRRKMGVDEARIRRDEARILNDKDYDHVIINNGTKKSLFEQIEKIYEEVKNK